MQHLAEAEWRAMGDNPSADSVVEPLWKWFRGRFERSSFSDRNSQIQQWGNIAHLQPMRSMALADLALSLRTAPASENNWLAGTEWDSHEHSLEWLPRMLAGIAEWHPAHVFRCFDLLWQLGRDKLGNGPASDQGHPISLMAEVVTYKYGRTLEIQNAGLHWLEHFLADNDWRQHLHKPGWLLDKLFKPMFETSVEESWSTGRTIHMRSHLLNLRNTAPLRDRALALCRKLLSERDDYLALQLIPVLELGCDIARLRFAGEMPKDFANEWEIERLKSLAVLEQMTRDFAEPLIHFQIRGVLMRDLRYGKDNPAYRNACRAAIRCIPDTLDLRVVRAACGEAYSEFERSMDRPGRDWHAEVKIRWETFVREVADAVSLTFPTASAWLAYFGSLEARWRALDFRPNFRPLLARLAERNPVNGLSAAAIVLGEPNHPLASYFDALAMSATKADHTERLRIIQAASTSSAETLQAAFVACCQWWRREGALPEEAWQILETTALTATPIIANRIVDFVWLNKNHASVRDWNLLAALPFQPADTALAGRIAARAADLVSNTRLEPDTVSVVVFLRRFEVLTDADDRNIQHAFERLAEAFPVEMFLTLWRREQARKAGDSSLKQLPHNLRSIEFPRIMAAPEVQSIFIEAEQRLAAGGELDFDEKRLLRAAIQYGCENPCTWLQAAASRATTEKQLNTLRELGEVGILNNAAIAYPDFARVLLSRARSLGPGCYKRMLAHLTHVGGARGSTDGEPDEETKRLLEAIECLVTKFAPDPELGPLFASIANNERSLVEFERRRGLCWEEDE